MRFVNTLAYARLLDAREYYESCGYKFIDVPWAVSREAILMTRPPHITGEPFSFEAGGQTMYPVASAEQSFLDMQLNWRALSGRWTGSFCAITPCFRNEAVLDNLHQPYFMKLELISWDKTTTEDLRTMIKDVKPFLVSSAEGAPFMLDVIENNDPDSLGVEQAYDIVTARTRIELGSYGIRSHPKVGRWLYGTGLAEPRYSVALEIETAYKTAAGRPS